MSPLCKISYRLLYSQRFSGLNFLPLKKILLRFYKKQFADYSGIILFDWNPLSIDESFIALIKDMGLFLGIIFTNIFEKTGIVAHNKVKLLDAYDKLIFFDDCDVQGYDHVVCDYTYSIESVRKRYMSKYNGEDDYDVFFIGKVKERYDKILEIYNFLKNNGLKCLFIVNDIDPKETNDNGIIFNKNLSYEDVLKYSSRSKCILELLQEKATKSTLRALEAITLNKIFLTNNEKISSDSIYDGEHMFVYNDEFDIVAFKKALNGKVFYDDKILKTISINNLKRIILCRE